MSSRETRRRSSHRDPQSRRPVQPAGPRLAGHRHRLGAGITQAPDSGGPDRHTCWLATIAPDGRPHVTGVGAVWHDGAFWFETGRTTRKGRNLARDARCSLTAALREFDLVVEGEARLVTEPCTVAELARVWAADWPCEVGESGIALTAPFSAPSAGPPPWHVSRIDATAATALQTVEPGGATRWTFSAQAPVARGQRGTDGARHQP